MTEEKHTCACGKSANVACTFCDEWFCDTCYEQKHRGGHVAISDSLENLEAVYGPAASYSEHKRGDHITYTSAEGERKSGTILWVCAPNEISEVKLGMRYLVGPDDTGAFVDVALPGDVITSTDEMQEPTLSECPYCHNLHESHLIESCQWKPKR